MPYTLLFAKACSVRDNKFYSSLENKSLCRVGYVFYSIHETQLLYLNPFWSKSISCVNANTSCFIICKNKRISAYRM